MALAPGTRLGPYEIQSPLGAGGMGEVYRATDANLGRDVALKVVSDSFTHDPERVARFRREAQLLAALNHPHIATIHGLEEANGSQFLVMELVEGDTLAERLKSGALPVGEALGFARQIAEALQAAHDKGIIHRDLKPANIALTADGQVKVLDFGLAKALESFGGSAIDSPAIVTHSPTLSLAATQAGVILGTAAYMAPEQAKGKPADKRSDIWAFGCVVYEMLTGRRAFEGEDVSDIVGAVLRLDPDWTAVPREVSPSIQMLLNRCLTKDHRTRISDISTALYVLGDAATLARTAVGADQPREQDPAYVRMSRRRVAAFGAAVGILGATVAGSLVWWTTRPPTPGVVRTEIATAGAMALNLNGSDRAISITPDGSRIIYRGNNQLMVRALDQLQPTVLDGLSVPQGVFVSPDGQWIGFFEGNSFVKKVAITGGPPVTVAAYDGAAPHGATWGPDGTIVYATNASATGLFRVPAAGGDPAVLTAPNRERGEADHLWPEFLPDGRAVLFTITATAGGLDASQVAVIDLATGAYKVLVRGGHHAHYVPTGHLVYGANGTLRAVGFDLDRLEAMGTPVPVLEGVRTTQPGGVDAVMARTGTMVYVPGRGGAGASRSLAWVDRAGREEAVPAPPRSYIYPRISPDGARVAVSSADEQQDIWVWDLARQTLTRLTLDPAPDTYPVWTPDGRRVVYASLRAAAPIQNLWWQPADGTGTAERLSESSEQHFATSVSPDGATLVFHALGAMRRDLMALTLGAVPLSRGTAPRPAVPEVTPLLQTAFEERNGIVSPNGRWLAYESDASGRFEIYVRPFPNVDRGQWQLSSAGGTRPLWSRNGQELFYLAPDGGLMAVRVDARGDTWSAGTPTRLFEGRYFTGGTTGNVGRTYDVSPDGRRFLMIKEAPGDDTPSQNLVVVQGWFEELKRLVPTN